MNKTNEESSKPDNLCSQHKVEMLRSLSCIVDQHIRTQHKHTHRKWFIYLHQRNSLFCRACQR